ncbi:hypothetical protein FOCC_FOCC013372 [Frankliniella occidentalis]|nr:hypothetical protein FOCC_FOCC013372 [Frankliniella occidentalis]
MSLLIVLEHHMGRTSNGHINVDSTSQLGPDAAKHTLTEFVWRAAAHCVEVRARRGRPSRPVDAAVLVVYLGKHDLLSYTEPGQQTAEVDSVLVHPDYAAARPSSSSSGSSSSSSSSTSSYDNDIALLVLTEAVEPSRHIRPVCLWEEALGNDLSAVVGQVGAVPGWGKDDTGAISNEIRVANMPIVSQETCTSVCNGDSGGGLFLRGADGRWRLRGIVSVSMFSVNEQACDAYNYAVFTDVAKFIPWLRERMAST